MARAPRQLSLAVLGDWPSTKIGRDDVVRRAYEQAIVAAARVFAFATGAEVHTSGPIAAKQDALAVQDLQDFATNGRRLIETTIGTRRASNILIPALVKDFGPDCIPITRIINTIVHHRSIHILGHRTTYRLLDSGDIEVKKRLAKAAVCAVTSDKDKTYSFDISVLIELFQERVLEPVVDLCSEQGLDLPSDDDL